MTNKQIIMEIAFQVYGEKSVMQMLENGQEIPLHTMKGWAQRGPYRIKKGEHGIETKLWRKKKNKEQSGEEDQKADTKGNENCDFYLCKSFLFRGDQVEKIAKK